MASLADCLANSLSPDPSIRRAAEQQITQAQTQPGFGRLALDLVQDGSGATPPSTRQSAALAFKNWVKREWVPEEGEADAIPASDRTQLKSQLVLILVSLSDSPALQVQIQEAVSIIAEADFPDNWSDLIDQLVGKLQGDNWAVNNALLGTAHSIFRRWRAEFRTDALFLQIKFVLERFCQPYLGLWKHVDTMLSSPDNLPPAQLKLLARTLLLLVQLYYDLNCQDIPEFFEDNLTDFMALLHKYLVWEHPALMTVQPGAAEDEGNETVEAGDLEKVKAGICEVVELYSQRYLDLFPMMGTFVETVWGLLTRIGPQPCFDTLVSKATRFLSVVVKMSSERHLFESPATLEAFCQKIVLPNMSLRGFEVEMFEDDPAEYVRRDLEGSDSGTRRQAASDFTHALMEQFAKEVTEIVTRYVQAYLQQYSADPTTNWKSKDAAVSLLASVASRSSTASAGVTSTNSLVDVVRFFSEHVVQDLQPSPSPPVHPIIVADAIKFLHTFRNQLNKEQLLQVIPMLLPHLQSENVVVHTYAAATIERILFMRPGGKLLFSQADIRPHADQLLTELFKLIRRGTTPQAIASNDTLMKCVMRIIITARQSLSYEPVLTHLVFVLGEISKNPSNPKFNHYTFESISAIVRFHSATNAATLSKIEGLLFPPFTAILTSDIQEFSPFVFQILSQLLELHSAQGQALPDTYASLLPPLLTPVLWEARGNVPALVRLLRAFLAADTAKIVADNRIPPMLGVFQKLVGSRANDGYGFELLEAILELVPVSALQPYLRNIFMLIFTRLQQSKTDKFVQGFLHMLMFAFALGRPELPPDTIIGVIDGIQAGIFVQIFEGVLIPEVPSTPLKRRRVVALGHVALLTRSPMIQSGEYSRLYLPILSSVLRLFTLPLITTANGVEGEDAVDAADLEDPGYQAGFSKLGASEALARKDPLEAMGDPRDALARGLMAAGGGKIPDVVREVPAEYSQPWMQWVNAMNQQARQGL